MNKLQKLFAWGFQKATGFPSWPGSWTTATWPGGLSLGGSMTSDAGININAETALTCSAIWACVRIRAAMMGHFPLIVYEKQANGIRILDTHPMYNILHDSPNAFSTSMEWRQAMSVNLDLYGNAFSEKKWIGKRVVALDLLLSERMKILKEKNQVYYEYTEDTGKPRRISMDDVLHIRNFSFDGIVGLNPIQQQRNAIGLSLAQQRFGAALYKNGGRPAGVLEHPGSLNKEAVDRLRTTWEEVHSSPENAGRVAILWEGMKYNGVGLNSEEMQFIEARKFSIPEIARIYGVPPHLLADLDRATNNNIEQQGIENVTYHLAPNCVLWEQRIKKSLLSKDTGVYAKFNVTALLRGDSKARAEFYSKMVQNGIMSRDECRDLEELRRRGGTADELTVQSNMLELDDLQKLISGDAGNDGRSGGQLFR